MKKFAGNKPLHVIKAQCKAAGLAFDDYNRRKFGRDYIAIGGWDATRGVRPDGSPLVDATLPGTVMFNTFNGRFFGTTDRGIEFSSDSDSDEHEGEPWMRALLAFFYVEKVPEAA
jgi:hypothetical protein